MSLLPSRLLAAAAALGGVACASSPQAATNGAPPSAAAVSAASGPTMVATLSPVSSPVTGLVRLQPAGRPDQLRAVITLRGAQIGAQLPWQIRQGRCDENGPELGAQAAYRTLDVRADGTADLRVTLPIGMPTLGTHSVRVLLDRTQMDRVVACGVLSPES